VHGPPPLDPLLEPLLDPLLDPLPEPLLDPLLELLVPSLPASVALLGDEDDEHAATAARPTEPPTTRTATKG
jgi:hypothetical protein